MTRKPLSKKTRFDVFKRDGFLCQYCGQRPPAVVLEVDHIIAVVEGGTNDEGNLLTSCFDCNRGKGAGSLAVAPIDLETKTALIRERSEQVEAYESAVRIRNGITECHVDEVAGVYEAAFPEWSLTANARRSIKQFLEHLPPSDLIDAMERAVARVNEDRAFKYFCGICWRKIKGDGAY